MTNQDNIGHKSVAQLIEARQNELGTTDHQIAMALGYTHERVALSFCALPTPDAV